MSSSPCMTSRLEMSAIGPLHPCHSALCVIEGLATTGHSTGNSSQPQCICACVFVLECHLPSLSSKANRMSPKKFSHEKSEVQVVHQGRHNKQVQDKKCPHAHTPPLVHWTISTNQYHARLLILGQYMHIDITIKFTNVCVVLCQ